VHCFIRVMFVCPTGQVVSSEVLMASESGCPIEVHRIEIEKCDEVYDQECQGNKYIPFHRAGYDRRTGQSPNSPREQVSSSYCGTYLCIAKCCTNYSSCNASCCRLTE
jgi:hypothetical protein